MSDAESYQLNFHTTSLFRKLKVSDESGNKAKQCSKWVLSRLKLLKS